jgi:hypothetical protein
MLMGNEHSNYELQLYAYWFIGLIVFPVVFMNLLISVIGDTFENTQSVREIENYREKVDMIQELETLCFWNRHKIQDEYLFMINYGQH